MQGDASTVLKSHALGEKHFGEFPKNDFAVRDFVCPLSGAHRDAATTEPARQRKSLEGRPPA